MEEEEEEEEEGEEKEEGVVTKCIFCEMFHHVRNWLCSVVRVCVFMSQMFSPSRSSASSHPQGALWAGLSLFRCL